MTPPARFARILRNPSLYPGVAAALGPHFPWHTHAASPRSSQALCLSAWAPLALIESRHAVIDGLLAEWLPRAGLAQQGGRRWCVHLEASDPDLLGERGGRASAVDVVLETDDAVVCVESKYLRDAAAGFRGCGQFPEACRGFYGPGSDRTGLTGAACRLAVREGRREARRYWEVAEGLFRPEALAPGWGGPGGPGDPGTCPLHRQYQLARTLLYAKALAGRAGRAGPSAGERSARAARRRRFAALVISPAATAGVLERQTAAFAAVLRPKHAGCVGVAHYEGLVRLLSSSGDPAAAAVGSFVAGLLPAAPEPAPPERTDTVRELRRRAEAERRRGLGRGSAGGAHEAGQHVRPRRTRGPAEDDGVGPRTMDP